MKKRFITFLLPITLIGYMMFQGGCVKEDFDVVPSLVDSSKLVKTATIAEIKALLTNTANVYKVKGLATPATWQRVVDAGVTDSSIVIEGYVTSNDSTGNFYEVITIQDATGGIDIKINASAVYSNYRLKPGQKIFVKVNNLYLGYYRGVYQLGASFVELGALKITGLTLADLPKYIERSGKRKQLVPIELTIDQINSTHVQKLVRINNVQFWSSTNTFSIPGENTNRTLIDCNGKMLVLRTSGFCSFTSETVPSGNGSITGVLSIFDSTYQLYIRDLNDIQFNNDRCGTEVPTPNKTIAELKALCTGSHLNITTDVVISGVISGNDESGNIYKWLNVQDETGGITFSVNISGLYPEFPVGNRVVINCNGLCIGKYGQQVQLGIPPYSTYVTRVEPAVFYSKVFTTESGVSITPIVTKVSGINDAMLNKLVTVTDVEFGDSETGKSWSDPTATANRNLEDIVGNKLIVRTSNYASFALSTLPTGSGSITAILTKYNSDYQLAVRDLRDVRLIKPRYTFLLSEGFSTGLVGTAVSINGWKTFATEGTKTWKISSYSSDNYAEMNPYKSNEPSNVAWLITPQVNLGGVNNPTLVFQTEYNYWSTTTSPLQVLISTDFDGTNVASATWTALSTARIVAQGDGTNKWISSGLVDLSAYTGNVYIGFKYMNTGGVNATAYRVDNLKIFSNK